MESVVYMTIVSYMYLSRIYCQEKTRRSILWPSKAIDFNKETGGTIILDIWTHHVEKKIAINTAAESR
jgi:hypothetical protein